MMEIFLDQVRHLRDSVDPQIPLGYCPHASLPSLHRRLALNAWIQQEKKRKVVVNDWINEYNALHKADDAEVRCERKLARVLCLLRLLSFLSSAGTLPTPSW